MPTSSLFCTLRPASHRVQAADMGFPLADVLTSDDLVEEFQCKICTELVEYTTCAHTRCGHVFCQSCLSTWMARAGTDIEAHAEAAMNGTNPLVGTRCPTCNANIERNTVSDLKLASPLAWRLLGRVKVRCPTHGTTQCAWRGDLSEVGAHLTDSQSHKAHSFSSTESMHGGLPRTASMERDAYVVACINAEALKEQGNAKFSSAAFREAVQLYSKAISVMEQANGNERAARGAGGTPETDSKSHQIASYYANRAVAWSRVGATKECVDDCRRALRLDPKHPKAHFRLIEALRESSDVLAAASAGRDASKRLPENQEILQIAAQTETLARSLNEGERLLELEQFLEALAIFQAAERSIECASATLGVARSEIGLGRCDRAVRSTLSVIKNSTGNVVVQAYAIRGHALCLSDDFDQGLKHLREALRLDPDHALAQSFFRKMKKTHAALLKARELVAAREFDAAIAFFSESWERACAPEKAPLFAMLMTERANCHLRLKRFDEALRDCDAAIESREDHKRAYYVAGNCLIGLGKPDEAAARLRVLLDMDPGCETTRRHHEKAVFETRKAKRPRYYEVLGVSSVASVPEIKQAYKQRCMEWHPDRHANSAAEERNRAEVNFKTLGEALEIMEDPMKRKLYDEGYDKEAISERAEAARRAARGGGNCGSGGCC